VSIWFAILLPSALSWLYLLVARGGFWRARIDDSVAWPDLDAWPSVTAIIPARNEADIIADTVTSLVAQDYAGPFSIVLVDDQSHDGTTERALTAAALAGKSAMLSTIPGGDPQSGWTGKLYALQQGLDFVQEHTLPTYVWLTDADISYEPDTLRHLVKHAEAGGYVLTSLMAKLRCNSVAEQILIPAFIFFFQMLYPFAWVNRNDSPVAAAAGGCMLARRETLQTIGGFAAIRGALIDDCALASMLKRVGPIWLGLTHRAASLRPCDGFEPIRRMVARSAYAQLHFSPIYLTGTLVAMVWVYGIPPAAAIAAPAAFAWLGAALWALMAGLYIPTLRFYRQSPLWGLALPLIALIYLLFTLDSAYQYSRGRGGLWKGRVQAARTQ
jgi:hopene-associated glycosyltransferase HpnB